MASTSRYLATVRRAISVPCALSSSTIFWSEYGLRGSSCHTSCLMWCFTASLAVSSPDTRAMDELKKYFSSKMPCGVCTYLFVVTRLTVDSCIWMSSATSLRINGRRCSTPRSKNSRWNWRMLFVTLRIVRWRCWIERMSHCAERSRSVMYSFASRGAHRAAIEAADLQLRQAIVVERDDVLVADLRDVHVGHDVLRLFGRVRASRSRL